MAIHNIYLILLFFLLPAIQFSVIFSFKILTVDTSETLAIYNDFIWCGYIFQEPHVVLLLRVFLIIYASQLEIELCFYILQNEDGMMQECCTCQACLQS